MNKFQKISIIIPTHNSLETVGGCLNSFLRQGYPNVELICIDDHSNDGTFEFCKKYSNKCKMVFSYCLENKLGVSAARNLGIEKSTGSIIGFADADDYASKNSLFIVNNDFNDVRIDIVSYGYNVVYRGKNGKKVTKINVLKNKRVHNYEFQFYSLTSKRVQGFVWNKFMRKKVLNGILFSEDLTLAEDLNFVLKLSNNIKGVNFLISNKIVYNYVYNVKSVSHGSVDYQFDKFNNLNYVNSLMNFKNDNLKKNDKIINLLGYKIYQCAQAVVRMEEVDGERKRKAKFLMNEVKEDYIRCYYINWFSNTLNSIKHCLGKIGFLKRIYRYYKNKTNLR
ncbi:glycosyltransferase family 2 protein [Liquorilactobacillus mali]|uniref:Glycosyltransferase 2-like domain-containing protein n=1 Tax=Liquorilactobacillus mali TaxID=1618 RepID=A0A0R2G8Y8_9LACO|nr:glycosyltransferase family A protein [Liquorilactobacillus mali]KRN33108.1 hypothetical protein IV36_GL000841 [Liquorilactobacillus mali]